MFFFLYSLFCPQENFEFLFIAFHYHEISWLFAFFQNFRVILCIFFAFPSFLTVFLFIHFYFFSRSLYIYFFRKIYDWIMFNASATIKETRLSGIVCNSHTQNVSLRYRSFHCRSASLTEIFEFSILYIYLFALKNKRRRKKKKLTRKKRIRGWKFYTRKTV